MLLRQLRLGLRRCRANHRRAPRLRNLQKQEPKPTCDGVHEDGISPFDLVSLLNEGVGGDRLQEARSSCAGGDGVGNGVCPFPGDGDVGGMGPEGVLG